MAAEGNTSGWTFDTLKKYIDERFRAAEQAIKKAEDQVDHRFTSVNEFRGALSDLSTHMLPRAEYDVQHKALSDRTEDNAKRIAALQLSLTELMAQDTGKKQGFGLIGSVIWGIAAVVSALVTVGTLLLIHKGPP